MPRLILRSGIEEIAKAERRMNEQLSNNDRRTIEHLSKKHLSSTTKLRKNHEKCKCIPFYLYHSQSFASRCVELRRNDVTKRKRGGDGGDRSIGGKKKVNN